MRLGIEAGADTVAAAIELGIKGVPVSAADLVNNGVKETLNPLDAAHLEVCQISAFGYNPLHPDSRVRAEQADMVNQVIPLAGQTGCAYIVICGGNYHPTGFGGWHPRNLLPEALEEVVVQVNPLVSKAAENDVKISIEPYLKTIINGPDIFHQLRKRMERPEALVANLDVTSHYDFTDFVRPNERCKQVCEGYAGAYGLGHIKDIGLNDGFHLSMGLATLGTSPTDWVAVLKMMQPHMPTDSWLILEHVRDLAEARRSVPMLRDYAHKAGVELS